MDPVTPVVEELSISSLILNASLPVQIILLILVLISMASWAFIISKYLLLSRTQKQTRQFEQAFWKGGNLNTLQEAIQRDQHSSGALARIFDAGMNEFFKTRQKEAHPTFSMSNTERAMRSTYYREVDALDSKLSFLSSAASASPYIGLLGTVWGIMHSFIGLSTNVTATLAAVAPGIAEALIATAIGLFAAIPAVIAYNAFSNRIDKMANHFDSFIDEFLNILQRQVN